MQKKFYRHPLHRFGTYYYRGAPCRYLRMHGDRAEILVAGKLGKPAATRRVDPRDVLRTPKPKPISPPFTRRRMKGRGVSAPMQQASDLGIIARLLGRR